MDYPELHQSIREIRGEVGEPIARLTPLGWTCVGKTLMSQKVRIQSHFVNRVSMFASNQNDLSIINSTLKMFWEIENVSSDVKLLSPDDDLILNQAKSSLKIIDNGTRYQVAIPWKEN